MMVRFACLLLCSLIAGCGALGAIAYKIKGADPVPAMHQLAGPGPFEKDTRPVRVLALAENYATSSDASVFDGDRLAQMITQELARHVKHVEVLDASEVSNLRSSQPKAFYAMSVAAVGRELKAEVVVHVRGVRVMTLETPGSELTKGRAVAIVRVINVAEDRVVWPTESTDGTSVQHETDYISNRDTDRLRTARTKTLRGLADEIAKLFYTWRPEEGITES